MQKENIRKLRIYKQYGKNIINIDNTYIITYMAIKAYYTPTTIHNNNQHPFFHNQVAIFIPASDGNAD